MTPRRPALALPLLALLLAGCSAPEAPAVGTPTTEFNATLPEPMMLALDGRWEFPRERGDEALARVNATARGEAWFGDALLARANDVRALDYAALDGGALTALEAGFGAPAPGTLTLDARRAAAWNVSPGDAVDVTGWTWPTPLVATAFEMDRTRPCEERPGAKLCLADTTTEGVTVLRLRTDAGAQDLAFLPDMAELGAGGAPAWWNGTFRGPDGAERAFQAHVARDGTPTPGALDGPLASGEWTIRYTLETLKGRAPAGLAGIVRLREPGYTWFDDRLQAHATPQAQARAVLDNATPATLRLTVAAIENFPSRLGAFDALLAPADAERLGDGDPRTVGALVATARREDARRMFEAMPETPDAVTLALHLRPLDLATPRPPQGGPALLFRAPPDFDVATLPPVEGAGAPTLALALRPPLGDTIARDGEPLAFEPRILAHAGPGEPAWTMPAGARWPTARDALENVSRSRTLVLGSPDLPPGESGVSRIAVGPEPAGRVVVLVGTVENGPAGTLWVAAPLAAGAGEPAGARVVLPVTPGEDAATVLERARLAYAPLGLAPEPSSKP